MVSARWEGPISGRRGTQRRGAEDRGRNPGARPEPRQEAVPSEETSCPCVQAAFQSHFPRESLNRGLARGTLEATYLTLGPGQCLGQRSEDKSNDHLFTGCLNQVGRNGGAARDTMGSFRWGGGR